MFKTYEERNISWKWIGLKFTRRSASCYPWCLPSNSPTGFLQMFLLSNGIMEVPAPLEPRSLKDIDLAGLAGQRCSLGFECMVWRWWVELSDVRLKSQMGWFI